MRLAFLWERKWTIVFHYICFLSCGGCSKALFLPYFPTLGASSSLSVSPPCKVMELGSSCLVKCLQRCNLFLPLISLALRNEEKQEVRWGSWWTHETNLSEWWCVSHFEVPELIGKKPTLPNDLASFAEVDVSPLVLCDLFNWPQKEYQILMCFIFGFQAFQNRLHRCQNVV